MTIRRGTPADVPRALEIWRTAVDATHGFLSPGDRAAIDTMVAKDFLPDADLWLALDGAGRPVGFLVMDGAMIDALFVDPACHGQGYGTALLEHALTLAPNATVDASEQADNALPFSSRGGSASSGDRLRTGRAGLTRWFISRAEAGSQQLAAKMTRFCAPALSNRTASA